MKVVSSPADDTIGKLGMAPYDGNCMSRGIGLVPGVLSFSNPNRGHHEFTNSHRTAFHRTVASPSLPETRSTYYLLLLELLSANQGA